MIGLVGLIVTMVTWYQRLNKTEMKMDTSAKMTENLILINDFYLYFKIHIEATFDSNNSF